MDKWRKLREWEDLPPHIARKMDELEIEQHRTETSKEGFLFVGVPKFDQKSWERILEEMGLEGLS